MAKKYEFDAVIRGDEKMDAGAVDFPYDVEKEFGTRGQVRVYRRKRPSSSPAFRRVS